MNNLSTSATVLVLLVSFFLSPVAYASKYEDDANQAISLAVRMLRVQNEQTESTDQYFKALPLYNIKSFSYPVTWGFNTEEKPNEPTILFSKKLSKIVSDKMVYKTPNFPNGMINVGAPLGAYHTRVYYPLLSDGKLTNSLKLAYIKPIIASMLPDDPRNNSYIDFCSFKSPAQSLADVEARMKNITTLGNVPRFDGESFIPNVYSSVSTDIVFMGLQAKKFTLVFDSRINKTPVRLKYEGLYALKDGYMLCGEVIAPEPTFDVFRKNFDTILASVVPSYEFGLSSGKATITPASTTKKNDRLCKRTKKC